MDGAIARIRIPFSKVAVTPIELCLDFMSPLPGSRLEVQINGYKLPTTEVLDGPNFLTFESNPNIKLSGLEIEISTSRTVRPSDHGDSTDERVLGLGLRSISFRSPAASGHLTAA